MHLQPDVAFAKIKSRSDIERMSAELRADGKCIGYTSGVFDLLHPGHVDYLQKARSQCDVLIVGLNSDASVRRIKGAKRPICTELDRAQVLSGLESVSHIFIFDEENNNKNVELLRPHIYFKAGEYSEKPLTSKPIVEAYGGKVVLVPMQAGFSSSNIISRVLGIENEVLTDPIAIPQGETRPAVFLDRDGTINEHIEYLHEPEKFSLLPNVLDALKKLQSSGVYLIIVTNQPGIGLGYFSKEDLFRVNSRMLTMMNAAGIKFDKVYFCPHSHAAGCLCRKPAVGMIERAARELPIDLARSFVVGDMTTDVLLGKNAGCGSILLQTGMAGQDKRSNATPDFVAKDLLVAADYILGKIQGSVRTAS